MTNIREVAKRAGVSPTTVSHVVNETRYVSEDTRARVDAAMKELGYRPNALARSLRRGQTHTIGLVLPDSSNPFFAEVARAVETAAFELGYSVILCNTEGDASRERFYVDVLSKKQVDALVFVAAGEQAGALGTALCDEIPVVVIDRKLTGVEVDTVLTDNQRGGYVATQHLLGLGHRRIGCISGPSHLTPSAERVEGYRLALKDAGAAVDETLIQRGDFHPDSGRQATLELLRQNNAPTAIFVCNDLMSFGALRAASEMGLRVPHDLAIVGFDDIDLASFTSPPLTTVAQPKAELGRLAVHMAIQHLLDKSEPVRTEILPVRLVVRESSGGRP